MINRTFALSSPRRHHLWKDRLAYLCFGASFGFLFGSFIATATISRGYEPNTDQQSVMKQSLSTAPASEKTKERQDGWNEIHVFYGNKSHALESSRMPRDSFHGRAWFSQLRQDEIISGLLRNKTNGYFIDLAANDAIHISNTFALETRFGWTGLCIEANPIYWSGLAHRNCTTVAAVIGTRRMDEVLFRFPNRASPKGGIVGVEFDNQERSRYGEDQRRFTVTLQEVLDRFRAPNTIDYLSLDVEGAEMFVMENFSFEQYRFKLLTIERPNEALCLLLTHHGYKLLKVLKKWGETVRPSRG